MKFPPLELERVRLATTLRAMLRTRERVEEMLRGMEEEGGRGWERVVTEKGGAWSSRMAWVRVPSSQLRVGC